MPKVMFRRIKGRIVPIRVTAKAGALGATAVGATVAGSTLAVKTHGTLKHPDPLFKYGSYAAQIASGVVAALPTKGKLGFALSIGGSIALDTLAAGLNAKSVAMMKGSKWNKAKAFGEQQAIGTGIGYGVFGAGLIARKDVRAKAVSGTISVLNSAKKWLRLHG